MERINARCGFLKCGRGFVRKIRAMPGDNCGNSPTNIRDKEEGITDTRSYGYGGIMPLGAAICSIVGWGQRVFEEEERLRDPEKSFIPFEDWMEADVDGRPFCVMGDDIVDEVRDIEEELAEVLDEDRFDFMPELKLGKIRVWHYPQLEPWPPYDPLFTVNHGKISTNNGEVTVFYKRRKIPAKPEPEKKPPAKTPFTQPPPKRTGIEALGSLTNAKKMPKLHQLASMARR